MRNGKNDLAVAGGALSSAAVHADKVRHSTCENRPGLQTRPEGLGPSDSKHGCPFLLPSRSHTDVCCDHATWE